MIFILSQLSNSHTFEKIDFLFFLKVHRIYAVLLDAKIIKIEFILPRMGYKKFSLFLNSNIAVGSG